MTKINSFIESSDFATLRNDDNDSFTVVVPGSVSVAAGAHLTYTNDLEVGTKATSARVKIQSSRAPGDWYITSRGFNRTGTLSGSPFGYTLYVNYYRISATKMRAEVSISNPYGSTLVTQSGAETFTFSVRTMILPFEQTA